MQSKEYKLPNGKTAVFEYDACGIGKITIECMDELMAMIADRPQGEWIVSYIDGLKQTECSACGVSFITYDVYGWNYCPWCGAKMKGADSAPTIEPKRGEWIPCSERMPEEEGRYLCTVNAELHQVRDMLYKPTSWGDEHRCKWKLQDGCYAYDWFVLAWMPLPQPWKGADDEITTV